MGRASELIQLLRPLLLPLILGIRSPNTLVNLIFEAPTSGSARQEQPPRLPPALHVFGSEDLGDAAPQHTASRTPSRTARYNSCRGRHQLNILNATAVAAGIEAFAAAHGGVGRRESRQAPRCRR